MAVAECTDAVAQTLSDVYIECPQIEHFFCALEESEDPKKDSHLRTFLFRGACSNSKVFVCIFPEKCTSLSSFGQTVPQTSHMYFLTDRPFFRILISAQTANPSLKRLSMHSLNNRNNPTTFFFSIFLTRLEAFPLHNFLTSTYVLGQVI